MGLLSDLLINTPKKYWGEKINKLGGLLGDAASTGAQAYGSASGPLSPEHAQTLGGLLMDFSPLGDAKSAYDGVQSAREGDYLGAALGGLGALPMVPNLAGLGHIAYHGSPHKFDKFDLSKIGTGEGAQAYGHGLYLAEAPEVALEYQKKLSSTGGAKNLAAQYGGVDDGIAEATRRIDHYNQLIANGGGGDMRRAKGMLSLAQKNLEDLSAMKAGLPENTGNFYKTDIPDEAVARFLDWDKPLSQQAPEVRQAIESHQAYPAIKSWLDRALSNAPPNTEATGQAINEVLAEKLGGQAAVSDLLRKQGIPGIRYLDGGSRSAGAGSSNFVAFDPSMIRILERNGQPTGQQPWALGEWLKPAK